MKGQWYFNRPKPGDKNREPILGEFFATEAISNPGEALVREGIQNSLDAGSGGLVRVRIYISGPRGALGAGSIAEYFDDLWPHITAEANGLHDPPTARESCPFLTFEDFGTSGLTGDVEQWHDIPGNMNAFYYFFRAEGQSGKSQQDRGRWGVGKTVFPRSSRISSYFGFTTRADEKNNLLMGQSVLKSHYVDTTYYSPDGYFGMRRQDGLTLPIDDPGTLAKFSRDFGLKRDGELGLSVIVPYCVDEITEKSLVAAVCRDYFYPILAAKLEVIVETPDREVLINHETILEVSQSIADELPQNLPILLELAEWATEQPPNAFIKLAESGTNGAMEWTTELISQERITTLRTALQTGERIAIRVPVLVREKNKTPQRSFYDVFLVSNAKSESGRPVFVRQGIIISDVRAPRSRGIVSLVVVQDDALATLLGDSENPAHTQWQKDSSNYKGKYIYGPSYIRFVVNSVSEIIKAVTEGEDKTDRSLLIDLFYLPVEKEIPPREEEGEREVEPPPPPPPPKEAWFKVQKVSGGFTVSNASKNGNLPGFFEVRVAYDIRRGNPLRKYSPVDFDLSKMNISYDGIDIKNVWENSMVAAIRDSRFTLKVTGFDEHRDLYVRVVPREELDDTQD